MHFIFFFAPSRQTVHNDGRPRCWALHLSHASPLLLTLPARTQEDRLFNKKVLGADLTMAFVHGLGCFLAPKYFFTLDQFDFWQMSLATYSLAVLVVTLRLTVHTRAFSFHLLFCTALSIGFFFVFGEIFDNIGPSGIRGAWKHLYSGNMKWVFLLFWALGTVFASEVFFRWCTDNTRTTNVDIVRSAPADAIQEEGDRRDAAASAAQKGHGEGHGGGDEAKPEE